MKTDRLKQIEEVLSDLRVLKRNSGLQDKLYAIEANIEFFESIRSIWGYVRWFLLQGRNLDPKRLLEINDLLPKYDKDMHVRLIATERKKNPGLIEPLVSKITKFILQQDKYVTICNLGSGGMEVERQIIARLVDTKYTQRVLFIGVDTSETAQNISENNLESLNCNDLKIYRIKNGGQSLINLLNQTYQRCKYVVAICNLDVFSLPKLFPMKSFDLVFSCLVRHHFTEEQSKSLEYLYSEIGKNFIEYDGYRSLIYIIPKSIESWDWPVFLNATIFSHLRFFTKGVIKNKYKNVEFSKIGTYLSMNKAWHVN